MKYIERSLEPVLKQAVREFPVLVLTGPRQSGKTTLLKHAFAADYRYVSIEPPDVRVAAAADPRGFIAMHRPPVIFDEIQYAPDLLPYIKEKVDANRDRFGQYLLTGSQNLMLTESVTESLAGRAALLRLMPLTQRELFNQPQRPLPWENRGIREEVPGYAFDGLWDYFMKGSYPELTASPKRNTRLWHSSYIQTYLERDVRSLRKIGELSQFQIFLQTLAARSAKLVNLSGISRDLGVAVNTIKAWLSILEATYQVIIVRPYRANIGKRLVKTPKVYFTDTGTLCNLVGLLDPGHAAVGPMNGAIMETAVVAEIFKSLLHRGLDPHIYFWRTSAGDEVDLLVEWNSQLIPIEVKCSATPRPAMTAGIVSCRQDIAGRVDHGFVINTGDSALPLGEYVTALPFSRL